MKGRGGNLVALALTRGVSLGTGLGLSLLIARLGPVPMGSHGWLLALSSLLLIPATWGMGLALVPIVAAAPDRAGSVLRAARFTLWRTAPPAAAALFLWAVARSDGLALAAACASVALAAEAHNQVVSGVLHGLRRMDLETPATLVGRALTLVLGLAAWLAGGGLVGVLAAQALGSAVVAVRLHHAVTSACPAASAPLAPAALLREATPYAANVAFATLYLSADLLMLHELRSSEEVGWYRLAALFALQLPVVADLLTRTALPVFVSLRDRPDALREQAAQISRVLLAIALPLSVGGFVLAEALITALSGGDAFLPSVQALRLLMLMLPLRFANALLGTVLSATDRQRARVRIAASAAVLNLALNAVAIPLWGVTGAASTTLLTDAVAFMLFAYAGRDALPLASLARDATRAALPAVAMGGVLWTAASPSLALALGTGALVVIPALRLTGAWTESDLRRLAEA